MTSTIKVDTISEQTSANGVTIDGVTLKDGGAALTGNLTIDDDSQISLGASADLVIRHNAANGNSFIQDTGTGGLTIQANSSLSLQSYGSSENFLVGTSDAGVKLYHNGNERLETTADGVSVSGLSVLTSNTPILTFIESDQSNKTYKIGSFGSAFSVYDDSNTEFRYIIDTNGNHIFNEGSQDCDFRVESNGNTHMLFVDGGNDHVYIGTSSNIQVNGGNPALQINGTDGSNAHSSVTRFSANAYGSQFTLGKSRSGTVGSFTIVQNNDQLGYLNFVGDDGAANLVLAASIVGEVDGTPGANDMPGRLVFKTTADGASAGTERMRIQNDGHVAIGATSTVRMLAVTTPASYSQYIVDFNNASTSAPYGIFNRYTGAAPDSGSDYHFLVCEDTSATRLRIESDGDINNHDNAYGAISDERIKQDIRDSNSQWNDIKAIKVRNYKKKDDVRQYGDNAWEQIGVIAQELEVVSPKLIRKHNPSSFDILSSSEFGTLYTSDDAETQDAVLYTADDQEVIDGGKNVGDIKTPSTAQIGEVKTITELVKSVNHSILYMKAIKALQEAMTRIETLETKVTALEG